MKKLFIQCFILLLVASTVVFAKTIYRGDNDTVEVLFPQILELVKKLTIND